MRVLAIFGTRPEAIKLAPVIQALDPSGPVALRTCSTGQHRRLLDDTLDALALHPDRDLDLMRPGQQPADFAVRALQALGPVFEAEQPDLVVVQGDTSSAMAGALAAAWRGIEVAHVEAGLRSGDLRAPFPEEGNRRIIDRVARLHFAPTAIARDQLVSEGAPPEGVHLTGNTAVDVVLATWDRVRSDPLEAWVPGGRALLAGAAPLFVLTAHRRESFGAPLVGICRAVGRLAGSGAARFAIPVHPNPEVDGPVRRALTDVPGVFLLPPLPHPAMIRLMGASDGVLTDSGGLQEEAPSLGRRVLVLREITERLAGLEVGAAELVGTDPARIEAAVRRWLASPESRRFEGPNPYGDGRSGARIAGILAARASSRQTA